MPSALYSDGADFLRNISTTCTSDADLAGQFAEHVQRLLAVPRPAVRRAWVQPVSARSGAAFHEAVIAAVARLHEAHSWNGPGGKRLSFGLVRVANISTAISTARALALAFPLARVACYHAREFRIQRYLKERRLDFLLNRKRGDGPWRGRAFCPSAGECGHLDGHA